ncbi:MAG: c-type cytochrome [Blastocatellia bacterium]
MTKKNHTRFVLLAAASLLFGLRALDSVSAHEGHKHSNAPASAKKMKNPLKADDGTIAAGRTIFNKNCASCHGEDGKSKIDIAAAMKKKPTDLTAKEMSGITDGEIYWVVTNGIKKSGMPAFKLKAKDQERWQMTVYVKHLMGEHPHAGHASASANEPAASQDHSAHHAAVNERGDQVMGFSHDKTTHHFRLKTDGGAIEVEANDANDTASRDQIRTHLRHIARKFSAGDFTAPMLIHDKTPPGVPAMKQLKAAIEYQFEETERGGRVRITTSDAKAIAAVHKFLRFQIADHQTGDSVKIG